MKYLSYLMPDGLKIKNNPFSVHSFKHISLAATDCDMLFLYRGKDEWRTPRSPTHNFNDGGGGPSDFFGSVKYAGIQFRDSNLRRQKTGGCASSRNFGS